MANKFNVQITGSIRTNMIGDNLQVDIRETTGRSGQAEPKPAISVQSRDPNFSVCNPVHPTSVQETGENPLCYVIKQGYALIIHNHYFPKGNLPDREGSDKDVEAIRAFCDQAGLRINDTDRKIENVTATEMNNLCSEIAKRSFERHDAFLCFILSHGNESGVYGVDDNILSVQEIVNTFKKCESLAGKPKLFFIQACRGTNKDAGIIQADSHPVKQPIPLRLPTDADVLIAHSTVDGYESYRNVEVGSWFIETLIRLLQGHAHHMHLMDILTYVNNEIASYSTADNLKQMPCQISTLTKFVYFNYPPPLNS